jgi:PKD repeat protein
VVDGRSYTVAQGAGGLWAEPYSYWLPVTVNSPGNLGSLWRSDAGLLSNGTSAASVELKFFPKGGTPTTTSVAVGAREQVILRDVIGQALGITPGKGPLKITSDQPLIVTSRTYNDSATGTLGQDYDGFSGDSGLSAGQSALIAQLTHKEPYRTNLGLTNMGSTPAVVRVTLYDGEGVQLAAFSVNLQPGSFWQEEVFKNNTTRKDLDACYAKVTVQSGSGILAHGSVIDGRTNDPTTLWGKLQCLKPTIATQPKDQGVKEGATATLSIAATGTAPLSYQWYQGSSGETTTPIAGATSSSLTTAAFTETGSFKYWARVSNDCGSADSATATVTVTPGCSATCTATVPTAAIRGKVVTFTGAATPANCDEPATVTWEWSFGDGSAVSTLQSPTYQYATPGSYNWTLKVSVGGVVKCSKSGTISIAEDYSGTWNGLTIQGWNISFTITDNVVTNVDFRVDGTSCWTSIKGRIPTNVIANKFKVIIYSWGIIEGFFDSATQAHGTVSSIYNSQCMVQPINWTAKKS